LSTTSFRPPCAEGVFIGEACDRIAVGPLLCYPLSENEYIEVLEVSGAPGRGRARLRVVRVMRDGENRGRGPQRTGGEISIAGRGPPHQNCAVTIIRSVEV